jgi:hypothetical protein
VSIRTYGEKAVRQLPGFVDRLVDQSNNPGCLRQAFLAKLLLLNLAHECDAGQMLTQPIVQILSNPALLFGTYFEDGLLQSLAFSDVDSGCDDVSPQ